MTRKDFIAIIYINFIGVMPFHMECSNVVLNKKHYAYYENDKYCINAYMFQK